MPEQTMSHVGEDESVAEFGSTSRRLVDHFRLVVKCEDLNEGARGELGAKAIRILHTWVLTSDEEVSSECTRLSTRAQAKYWCVLQDGITRRFWADSPRVTADSTAAHLVNTVGRFADDLDAWARKEGIDIAPILERASSHFRDDYLRPRSLRLTEDEIRRLAKDDECNA